MPRSWQAARRSAPPAPRRGETRRQRRNPGPTGPARTAAAPRDRAKSNAANPRAYRQDAAHHIYDLNQNRIYKGRLPPLLYAVGVLQVELDGRRQRAPLHWMRAPDHAPEVMAEIERTVRAAAPFPAPARMGKVI